LCAFSFEEAKGLVEKQGAQKNNDPLWGFLLQVVANITVVEKQYLNLSFLAPKGFLRKEVRQIQAKITLMFLIRVGI